jgi:hypothetical protein
VGSAGADSTASTGLLPVGSVVGSAGAGGDGWPVGSAGAGDGLERTGVIGDTPASCPGSSSGIVASVLSPGDGRTARCRLRWAPA